MLMVKEPRNGCSKGSFSLNLGIVCPGGTLTDEDRQCAWELYTELSTRVAVTGKTGDPECYDFGGELYIESLASLYDFFQEARKDPQRKFQAMDKTGLCFFFKGWYADAIDIFKQAIETCEIKDSAIAKELRYNLARSYEEDGQIQNSLELYRKLAQLDFGYKDVAQRVDDLRNIKE